MMPNISIHVVFVFFPFLFCSSSEESSTLLYESYMLDISGLRAAGYKEARKLHCSSADFI